MVARKARAAESDAPKPPIAFEGLPRLVASIRAFEGQAIALDAATEALAKKDGVAPAQLLKVNDALTKVERSFLIAKGLPGRPWFKHAVYAPGLTTGYASWTLPGVRQAVIDNDADLLNAQVPRWPSGSTRRPLALKVATEAAWTERQPAGCRPLAAPARNRPGTRPRRGPSREPRPEADRRRWRQVSPLEGRAPVRALPPFVRNP